MCYYVGFHRFVRWVCFFRFFFFFFFGACTYHQQDLSFSFHLSLFLSLVLSPYDCLICCLFSSLLSLSYSRLSVIHFVPVPRFRDLVFRNPILALAKDAFCVSSLRMRWKFLANKRIEMGDEFLRLEPNAESSGFSVVLGGLFRQDEQVQRCLFIHKRV